MSLNWGKLYDNFINNDKISPEKGFDVSGDRMKPLPEIESKDSLGTLCLQHDDSYIITTRKEGLVIIDQRRGLIKILFERYIDGMSGER